MHDLGHPQQAFFLLLGPLPKLGRAPAAGQDGLSVLQRNGWDEFKGGFDEPVETGNHGSLMPEKWKWVKGDRRSFVSVHTRRGLVPVGETLATFCDALLATHKTGFGWEDASSIIKMIPAPCVD